MLNKCIIQGRLTRDPEMRRTGSGTAVTSFTLAVDRDFADKESGERGCDFIDCVAWRQTAEFVSNYFAKGKLAIVSGRLQIRSYKDKDDIKRKVAEIVADNVYFGESKHDTGKVNTSEPVRYDSFGVPIPATNSQKNFEEITDDDASLPF